MPYAILPENQGKFKVINSITKEVHSFSTTKKKAEAQVRLLNAIEHSKPKRQKIK